MPHRHHAHGEAVAWITLDSHRARTRGDHRGKSGTRPSQSAPRWPGWTKARHIVILLGNPTVGTSGIHQSVVTALGQASRFHTATLIPLALRPKRS